MGNIISVSRRTDIPAFYGDWFMERVKEGFAGYVNPFSGKKHMVSLKPDEVICFVFWSKNFSPFMDKLPVLEKKGYKFYFNYTVNGYPKAFEPDVPELRKLVGNLQMLSDRYSPEHINWRYDPIVISDVTDYDFHLEQFSRLASELNGYVKRCYFSFVNRYGKVIRNFESLQREQGLQITEPDTDKKVQFAVKLAEIAARHGITIYTCCGDYLLGGPIKKSRCIDGDIINRLFFNDSRRFKQKPTRKECGCTESYDIGAYDTCPHGCVYCYANAEKTNAGAAFENHDRQSAFLGRAKEEYENV
jgi:hypothetical protein